jgi:replication factor C subunit 1
MIQKVARQSPNSSALLSEALHADADSMLYSSWAAAKAARLAGPSNPGSKAIPPAAVSDCLAGLSFVFTGELSSFSREEAVDIAKRFCGWVLSSPYIFVATAAHAIHSSRVVGQPSSKTDYVVLGDNAGPSKLAAIKKHNLKSLSEDEFLDLIATRKGPGDGKGLSEKEKKKKDKEEKAIRDSAKEMEAREKAIKAAGSGSGATRGCAESLLLGNQIDTATGSRQ